MVYSNYALTRIKVMTIKAIISFLFPLKHLEKNISQSDSLKRLSLSVASGTRPNMVYLNYALTEIKTMTIKVIISF